MRRQLEDGEREHFGGVHEVVDAALFVRLMREIENPRSVRDAMRDAGDAGDVLVIVGAGAGDQAAARGRAPAAAPRSSAATTGEPSGVRTGCTTIKSRISYRKSGTSRACASSSSTISRLRRVEAFLEQEPAIEHGAAAVGDARRLDAVDRLAAVDAVDVERRVPRARRHHRHRRRPRRELRLQLAPHAIEHDAHVLDRAHAMERHAAVAMRPCVVTSNQ